MLGIDERVVSSVPTSGGTIASSRFMKDYRVLRLKGAPPF